jgi:hypothetical protein
MKLTTLPSSVEVKKKELYPYYRIRLHGVVLDKYHEQLYLPFYNCISLSRFIIVVIVKILALLLFNIVHTFRLNCELLEIEFLEDK